MATLLFKQKVSLGASAYVDNASPWAGFAIGELLDGAVAAGRQLFRVESKRAMKWARPPTTKELQGEKLMNFVYCE
jgi:hypothetical protein